MSFREQLLRELPRLLREDPALRQAVLELVRPYFAERQATEDRFERMFEELRLMREESERRWREQVERWERRWQQFLKESERRWQQYQEEWRQWREESERRWQEWKEESERRWREQVEKWERRWQQFLKESEQRWQQYQKESERRWQEQVEKWERRWQQHREESERRWQQHREESERRWQQYREEWRQWREESERRWQQHREESERRWQQYQEEWQQWKEESERRWQQYREEIRREFQRVHFTLGAIGARWGQRSEATFRNAAIGLLREYLTDVKVQRLQIYDEEGEVFDHPTVIEMDLFIHDGRWILGEIKTAVRREDVFFFVKKARFAEAHLGRKADRWIMISPFVTKEARELVHKFGITLYTFLEDIEQPPEE